jgi:phage-related protein
MALEAFSLIGRIALDGADKVTRGLGDIGKRTKTAGTQMESFGNETFKAMDTAVDSTDDMTKAIKEMREEMRAAMQAQKKAMQPFRAEQLKTQKSWWDLTKATKDWKGSTKDLLNEVTKLGQAEKKVTESMLKNNDIAKMGLLMQVGTMAAMSTQSEKVSQNYDRMGSALYTVNKPLLAITDGLENIAKAGQPAALALRMLGANANMKDLQGMIGLINKGLIRFQAVAIAAGIALVGFTAAMANAAHGDAPAKIREQMAEVEKIYQDALEKRRQELYEWASIFEDVEFKPPNPAKLIAILDEQVRIFDNWAKNLDTLLNRGLDAALVKNLEKLGPKAAAEVQSLTNMTDEQLQEYEDLWWKRQNQANNKAISELQKLREETDKEIQKLKDSIMPLGLAWEDFQKTWAAALAPFIESWGEVAAKVVDAGTAIGDFFVTLNENDMSWVIKAAGWFLYMFTALTLLLSPLAIGVGLMGGFMAAWAMIAPIIMPLLAGLAAMSGTIVLVIAGVAALVTIITMLVNGFKDWLNGSEEVRAAFEEKMEAMRSKVEPIMEKIKSLFTDGMAMIKAAVQPILAEIEAFWSEHGMQVMAAVQNFLGFLGAIFNVVFPILKFIVLGALNAIMGIFTGLFNIVMGALKIFTGLFTGDWGLFFEGIKQVLFGWIEVAWNALNLLFIGRVLKGIGAFFGLLKSIFSSGFTTIRLNVMYFIDGVKRFFTGMKDNIVKTFTNMKNSAIGIWNSLKLQASLAIEIMKQKIVRTIINMVQNMRTNFNNIKNTVVNIFNGIKTAMMNPINSAKTAIGNAISWIRSKFAGLKLKLPKISVPKFSIKNWSVNPKNWIKRPPYIDIDWNKRGAFFDQATVLQGLGEKGKEAIIPIQNRRYMQPFSKAIAENLAGMQGGGARIEVPIILNNREILRAILPDLDRALKERQHRNSGLVNRGNL